MAVVWLFRLVLLYVVCRTNFATKCGHDEFPCNDGSCIDKSKWCDTSVDCEDDSDEMYCFTKTPSRPNPNRCNETFFLCNDGLCIPLVGRCDGYTSCPDNSDEENCDTGNVTEVVLDLSKTEAAQFPRISEKARKLRRQLKTQVSYYDLPQEDSAAPQSAVTKNETDVSKIVKHSDSENKSLDSSELPDAGDNFVKVFKPAEILEMVSTVRSVEMQITKNASENSKHLEETSKEPKGTSLEETANSSSSHHDVFLKYVNNRHDAAKANKNYNNGSSDGRLEVSNTNKTVVQGDSGDSKNATSKVSLKHGFSKLNLREYRRERSNAQQWLLKMRDEDYGWGDETARATVALYMSDSDWIGKHVNEKRLSSNNLHLKLFTALIRNQTAKISLGELALYINALSASCSDPRNFYGQDLINILRYRTNAAQSSSQFVTPLVYLTLCLNNASTFEDVRKLQDIIYGKSKIDKTDITALVSLAATCISRQPKFSGYGIGHHIAKTLYQKVSSEGLPENIYELALVTQALNEGQINHNLWNRSEAMKVITSFQNSDGSFGDILSTYYAVPTLSGKSLVSLGEHCQPAGHDGLVPLEVLNNGKTEKMYVHYSLYFGDPLEVSQSLMMKVPKSTNFLDIMRMAQTVNPFYKFRYDMSNGKPTIYSIGGIVNDAEQGLYWTLHVSSQQNSTEKNLKPYEGDIRTFVPKLGDYVVFWRKPVM